MSETGTLIKRNKHASILRTCKYAYVSMQQLYYILKKTTFNYNIVISDVLRFPNEKVVEFFFV